MVISVSQRKNRNSNPVSRKLILGGNDLELNRYFGHYNFNQPLSIKLTQL